MNISNLSCNYVSKEFFQAQTQLKIFDQMSYSFQSNKSYALMGPSGIGKSTLMAMMAGIEHPSAGSIALDDVITSQQPFEKRMKLLSNSIGMVFQQPCLIGELTVLENVMLKAIVAETESQESIAHGLHMLAEVGLADKASCFPHNLSGGQQQKVAILRSIFYAPRFLLADEPTGNLDQRSAEQIIALLLSYQKKYAMGLIISTHDISVAKQCDLMLKIEDQKLVNFVI